MFDREASELATPVMVGFLRDVELACQAVSTAAQPSSVSAEQAGCSYDWRDGTWRTRRASRGAARPANPGAAQRYHRPMGQAVEFTIAFEEPDELGWIVARVLEVPGALSQGRTRDEARENVLDALQTVLTRDEELLGQRSDADVEHLRFVAA